MVPTDRDSQSRRKFIATSAKVAGGLALLGYADANGLQRAPLTVQQVIDLILREGELTPFGATVDTIKSGRADQPVTGIVTTMFPTVPVIESAVKLKANFIIAHEPSYYNHRDNPDWVPNNSVLKQKRQLLDKNGIAIWRFHDYCHSLRPDAVAYGVAKKANWLAHYKTGQAVLTIPPISLGNLVQHLKTSLGIAHVRIIGDLDQLCERILLIPGAAGGQRQVSMAEAEKPDVLIVGEVSEWETAEYIRDGKRLGSKTSLIVLGHSVSEEPGMEWLVDWLQPKLPETKITHVPSGDPFTWL